MGGGSGTGIPQNFDLSSILGGGSSTGGGMFGSGSTLGGGIKQIGTTQAVAGDKAGELKAYDPNTMSMTTAPAAAAPPPLPVAAGLDQHTGLPSYITNFLASGGKDKNGKPLAIPTQSETDTTPFTRAFPEAAGIGAGGKLITQKPDASNYVKPDPVTPPVTAPPTAAAAAAPAAPTGYPWQPKYGPEPPLTPQQKLQVQIPGSIHFQGTVDPAVSHWLRWNLGEQGYNDYLSGRANQRAIWQNQAANVGASGDRLDR